MNPRTSFFITGLVVMMGFIVFLGMGYVLGSSGYPEVNSESRTAKDYISIHYRTRTAQGGCNDAGCCEFMGEYKGVSGFRCLEYKEYWISNGELNKPVNLTKEWE